jgi:hypothetical protein
MMVAWSWWGVVRLEFAVVGQVVCRLGDGYSSNINLQIYIFPKMGWDKKEGRDLQFSFFISEHPPLKLLRHTK